MERSIKTAHAPQVGAPDPELRNSPIFDENDAEALSLDRELQTAGCWFNSERYANGQYIHSSDELLRCERGVWVRVGEDPH